MEDKDEEGAATPPLEQRICGVERQELLAIASREDDTPAAAIAIGGQAVNMNVEGQPEHFGQSLQSADCTAGSSAGGSTFNLTSLVKLEVQTEQRPYTSRLDK